MKTKGIFLLALMLIVSFISIGQTTQDTTVFQVETNDGNEFLGEIVLQDSVNIILKTQNFGELTISRANIKSLKRRVNVQQIKDGKLWFENPQSTRYFWSPNGYGLKKGEGYYQNIWVLWNQFSLGLSDNFSVGGRNNSFILYLQVHQPRFSFTAEVFEFLWLKISLILAGGQSVGTILGEEGSRIWNFIRAFNIWHP
jgi:hypothetical protein